MTKWLIGVNSDGQIVITAEGDGIFTRSEATAFRDSITMAITNRLTWATDDEEVADV